MNGLDIVSSHKYELIKNWGVGWLHHRWALRKLGCVGDVYAMVVVLSAVDMVMEGNW